MTPAGALVVAALVGSAVGSIRWLRVAQREHYLAPAASRFGARWWRSSPLNLVLAGLAGLGAVGVWADPALGWLGLAAAVGPIGLRLRGSTGRLEWTPRLRRLAVATALLVVGAGAASLSTARAGWSVLALVLLPALVDLALFALAPLERRLGSRWVGRARARLQASGARVIAVTGSFGKTTTKSYIGHLLAGRVEAVISPASYNNRMGLARAINERLGPGAAVFVAEMGTYRRGEIADLCEFVPPEVAIITAIGPVHLERFGSEAAIVEAKREILERARVGVLNTDHESLARVAAEEESRRRIVRISARDPRADVSVVEGILRVEGQPLGPVPSHAFPSNLAGAVAAIREIGLAPEEIAGRIPDLPASPHRRQVLTSEGGFLIVDDTYNSNPAGAAAALEFLIGLPGNGRRVVVTPGMIELGPLQPEENARFARNAAERASDLVVVGKVNRRALLEGAGEGTAAVTVVGTRAEAVDWVRSQLGPGDAVLYENDLPDHYP
jgi:UDP-N-acetylmuramoyl-tripeptide--D-alanyl-D-alanine ligase